MTNWKSWGYALLVQFSWKKVGIFAARFNLEFWTNNSNILISFSHTLNLLVYLLGFLILSSPSLGFNSLSEKNSSLLHITIQEKSHKKCFKRCNKKEEGAFSTKRRPWGQKRGNQDKEGASSEDEERAIRIKYCQQWRGK